MFKIKSHELPDHLPSGGPAYIITGLGNPGREYDNTRHNVGFAALDCIARKAGAEVRRIKFKSLCGDAVVAGHRVLLLKPQTYMNLSGQAVGEAVEFYKIPMDRVIILCDDIYLKPGKIRIRPKGSSGGHNGLKNIIYLTGTDVFPRVRIGVGEKPHPDYDLADWVLGRPAGEEAQSLLGAVERVAEAVETILTNGVPEAMSRFNG